MPAPGIIKEKAKCSDPCKLNPKNKCPDSPVETNCLILHNGKSPYLESLEKINNKKGTCIDFSFLMRAETTSRVPYVPSKTSGVTVGTGVDLAHQDKKKMEQWFAQRKKRKVKQKKYTINSRTF